MSSTSYLFAENTERLMLANDPRMEGVRVEPMYTMLPNLASRLGRALNQSNHIKDLVLAFDCFDSEERESSLFETLKWISTSSTLSSIVAKVQGSVVSGRSATLLLWLLDALCVRDRLSLPPLKCIKILYDRIYVDTFVRILHVCRPASLTLYCRIVEGSLANQNDAVNRIRDAVLANTSLKEVSLSVRLENVAFYCAILECLPRGVDLARLNLNATESDEVPQQLLDTLLPRLHDGAISLKHIEFIGFSWTEMNPMSTLLDRFLPYVETLGFGTCSFDKRASMRLLSVFDSKENSPSLPSKLCLRGNVQFPDSMSMLQRLSGSTPRLHELTFNNSIPVGPLEGALAGLASQSSCLEKMYLLQLGPQQCRLLVDAMPSFRKLKTLGFTFFADFTPFEAAFFKTAKRNGSIECYNVFWANMMARHQARLEHYARRNACLSSMLESISAPTTDDEEQNRDNSGWAMLPSLLRASMHITVTASTSLLGSLMRSGSCVGLYQETQGQARRHRNADIDEDSSVGNLAQRLEHHEHDGSDGSAASTSAQRLSQRKRRRLSK